MFEALSSLAGLAGSAVGGPVGIGLGLAGALIGGISTKNQHDKDKYLINRDAEEQLRQLAVQRQIEGNNYSAAKVASDRAVTEGRGVVTASGVLSQNAYNNQIDQIAAQAQGNILQQEGAFRNMQKGIGSAYSDAGYSGVRAGGANTDAIGNEEDYQQRVFDAQNNIMNSEITGAYRSAGINFEQNLLGLSDQSLGLNRQWDSYRAGGVNQVGHEGNIAGFDSQAEAIDYAKQKALGAADPGVSGYFTNMFNGALAGMSFGSSISETYNKYKAAQPTAPATIQGFRQLEDSYAKIRKAATTNNRYITNIVQGGYN